MPRAGLGCRGGKGNATVSTPLARRPPQACLEGSCYPNKSGRPSFQRLPSDPPRREGGVQLRRRLCEVKVPAEQGEDGLRRVSLPNGHSRPAVRALTAAVPWRLSHVAFLAEEPIRQRTFRPSPLKALGLGPSSPQRRGVQRSQPMCPTRWAPRLPRPIARHPSRWLLETTPEVPRNEWIMI